MQKKLIEITTKERSVLSDIVHSEYQDGRDNPAGHDIWLDYVIDSKSRGGVLTSLHHKGLVDFRLVSKADSSSSFRESGITESTIHITQLGLETFNRTPKGTTSEKATYRMETNMPLAGRHETHSLQDWQRIYGYTPDTMAIRGGKLVPVSEGIRADIEKQESAKRQVGTIDMTPTWASMIDVLAVGTTNGHADARRELLRALKLADGMVAVGKKLANAPKSRLRDAVTQAIIEANK